MSEAQHQLLITLVHGTWPRGFFPRRQRQNRRPLWFEAGSPFLTRLSTELGDILHQSTPLLAQRAGWQRNVSALSMYGVTGKREETLAVIPKALQEHINTAYPAHVCLVGTTLPNGYAQITPRGSTMVYDDDHFALWERGKGSTNANLADGTKVTIFFRKPPLREAGLLPRGGIARFYGTAKIYKSGPIYEEIWNRLIEPEKKGDPDKKGFGLLIKVERAEDLGGAPLTLA